MRINYKNCKVFNDGRGGTQYEDIDKFGNFKRYCLGAFDGDPDWPQPCEECRNCIKWINFGGAS